MTRPDAEPGYSESLAAHLEGRFVESPGSLMDRAAGCLCNVNVTRLAISSTDIRQQIAKGRNPRFLLPSTVLAYIRKHGLYHS